MHASQTKVEAILKVPVPKNVTEVKSSMFLVNCHAQFIHNLSTILHPVFIFVRKMFLLILMMTVRSLSISMWFY